MGDKKRQGERSIGSNGTEFATVIAGQRTSPGVLLFTESLELLFVNEEALAFNKRLADLGTVRAAQGVLCESVMEFCEELLLQVHSKRDPKDWEQFQLRKVVTAVQNPVLLRGIGVPRTRTLLILMENLSEQQRTGLSFEPRYHLTDRERAVVSHLLMGMTNKQIAEHLQLSEHTIKDHLKRIMHKTNTTTRTAVIARIGLEGLAPDDRKTTMPGQPILPDAIHALM